MEEQAEQDRASRHAKRAESEADRLRSELHDDNTELFAERERLKKLAVQAVSDRIAAGADRKEVVDRRLQIEAFQAELQHASEEADKKVFAGIQSGREAIEWQEQEYLSELSSDRTALGAQALAVETEVQRLKAQLNADVNEAAEQLRRSAAVQLCAIYERCRDRCIVTEEQKRAGAAMAETGRQREEQRCRRDEQLQEVSEELASSRKATAERRKTEKAKAERRKKALLNKIAHARRRTEQLEHDSREHEVEHRRQQVRATASRLAEQSRALLAPKAPSPVQPRQPMNLHMNPNMRNFNGRKASGLHAEFPLLGMLQELDQEIHLASRAPLVPLPVYH